MREFGLIGKDLEHSFSPSFFQDKFQKEGIEDASYECFPLEDIGEFPKLLERKERLAGLNVTIPYKETVIPYLDHLSGIAEQIGAVNTICFENDRKIGHNTDVDGFKEDLQPMLLPSHRKALILGTGGASKAVHYVLKEQGFSCLLVSRNGNGEALSYEELKANLIAEQDLIVNCTPLGMWPDLDAYPPIPYEGIRPGTVLYDLIYEPPITRFLEFGKEHGALVKNGHGMLVAQAEASWHAWTQGCPD